MTLKRSAWILAAAAALAGPGLARAATYYVDSASGDDSRNGLSPFTPWQTLAKAGSVSLGPGDALLLRRGGMWRETLTLSASGTRENPARVGAYGEGAPPLISGADLASGWTQIRDNVYQAPVAVRPNIVIFDGAQGTEQAKLADLAAPRQWHWSPDGLAIFSASDPESAYTPPQIEAGARPNCIVLSSAAFVTVQDLRVGGGNGGTGEIYTDGGQGLRIERVTAEDGASDGIRLNGTDGAEVVASTVASMGRHGIVLVDAPNATIEGNTIGQTARFNVSVSTQSLKGARLDHNTYRLDGPDKFEWAGAASDFATWRKRSGQDAASSIGEKR